MLRALDLRTLRSRSALVATATAIALVLFGSPATATATPAAGGANNVVIAEATAGAPPAERSNVQVSPLGSPTIAPANIALARSFNCIGCRTVAVAFQAVLVPGSPDTVTPQNAAIASNLGCDFCFAYAYAYQCVSSTDGTMRLSPEGWVQLEVLRIQVAQVASSGGTVLELTTALQDLKQQFKLLVESATDNAATCQLFEDEQ